MILSKLNSWRGHVRSLSWGLGKTIKRNTHGYYTIYKFGKDTHDLYSYRYDRHLTDFVGVLKLKNALDIKRIYDEN